MNKYSRGLNGLKLDRTLAGFPGTVSPGLLLPNRLASKGALHPGGWWRPMALMASSADAGPRVSPSILWPAATTTRSLALTRPISGRPSGVIGRGPTHS